MKVVFVSEGFKPGIVPCAKRMGMFADCFEKAGHEVVVLASSTNLEYGDPDPLVVYCWTLPMRRKTALRRLANNLSFPFSASQKRAATKHADVVIVTSPPLFSALAGLRIAAREKAKLVFDVRDVWPEIAFQMKSFSPSSIYGKVFARIAKLMYRKADLVTTVTSGKVEKMKGILERCSADTSKLVLVENGLDLGFLEQKLDDDFSKRYPSLLEGRACVYVGNLGLAQGLDQLIDLANDAHRNYPEIEFLLFGEGADEDRLKALQRDTGRGNVRFCGTVTPAQAFTILSLARMAFVPLKNGSMTSSIPTKLYEALGVGCPVLLAAKGDAADLLKETNHGICVAPSDRKAIYEAFSTILEKREAYDQNRVYASRIIVQHHSRQETACVFEALVASLVKAGKEIE